MERARLDHGREYPGGARTDDGLHVVLSAQTRTRTSQQAVEELLGYRCAALVVIAPELDDVALRKLAKRARLPFVAVNQGPRNRVYDVVRSAGHVGIELLVKHLLGLGHSELAYLDAPAMPPAAHRLEGYLRAMRRTGHAPDVVSVDGPDYTEEAGAAAARQLLGRRALPTAVLACNDQVAVGALLVLSRADVAVPRDVSLTGFDDSRVAALSSVDLTTARQDPQEIGRAVVDAAMRRINDATARSALHVVQPTLVVRGSSAPAR